MRLILILSLTSSLSLHAFGIKKEEPPVCCEELPFDHNLFRKDVQVISGHVEFLYWTVNQGCLDYALKMQHSAWGPTPSYAQGIMESATFNWDPGFRIGMSYFRAPKEWEVRGFYTRLTARGNTSKGKPSVDTKYLTGTWPQITSAPLAGAQSHVHMNYNVFNLDVDRYFNPNPHLRMRVFGGGAVAWIDQDWKVRYLDSSLHGTVIRNRWKFVGGGMGLGLMIDWYWGLDIYITASASTTVYIGNYKNRSSQTTNVQPNPLDNTSIPIRDLHFEDTRPAFQAQSSFGPSWQKNYCNYRIEAFIGYEFTAWANLNQIYHSTAGGPFDTKETWINSSMTSLQGITARLTADF